MWFISLALCQEAAQALIYAGMAGSQLDGIQEKVNEYLDRVQALHNAGKFNHQLWGQFQYVGIHLHRGYITNKFY